MTSNFSWLLERETGDELWEDDEILVTPVEQGVVGIVQGVIEQDVLDDIDAALTTEGEEMISYVPRFWHSCSDSRTETDNWESECLTGESLSPSA